MKTTLLLLLLLSSWAHTQNLTPPDSHPNPYDTIVIFNKVTNSMKSEWMYQGSYLTGNEMDTVLNLDPKAHSLYTRGSIEKNIAFGGILLGCAYLSYAVITRDENFWTHLIRSSALTVFSFGLGYHGNYTINNAIKTFNRNINSTNVQKQSAISIEFKLQISPYSIQTVLNF